MKNGEKPGGSAEDEQVLTGYEDGIPPFGGEDANIYIPLDSDAELSDDGAIDDSEIQQLLEHDDPVQFEDSDTSIDVPVNEPEGSKPEISKEDFESAYGKYRVAVIKYAGLTKTGNDAKDEALIQKLKGLSAFSKVESDKIGLFMSYEEFVKSGHTLEELNELTSAYEELTGSTVWDDPEADSISNEPEGSKPEISKEDFESAKDKLKYAYGRWSGLYFGDYDPSSNVFSHGVAYRIELEKRLGREGYLYSSFLHTSYEDFIAEGHTLEEISEDEKKFTEMADAIEAIDMSDFKEPSNDAGEPFDAEKQEELKEAFDIAIGRFDGAYYGDNISSEESGMRISKIYSLMDDRGEKAALLDVVDFSFNSPSEITQDIIDEVNRVTGIIEGLDLDDDLGAGGENNPDLEDDESRTELLEDLDDSAGKFKSAVIETGLCVQNSDRVSDLEPLYVKLREMGEEDAFQAAVNSWANIRRNPGSAKPEDIHAVKAELDRFTELLKNLKADSTGDASNSEDYQEKFEQFAPEYKKAVDDFNAVIVRLGYVDTVNDMISSECFDHLRSIGEYDNYTKMVKQASDYINKKSDPSEWPGMLEELKRITKVLNGGEGGDDGSEGGENAEDQERKAEAIDKLINTRDTKRIDLLLEKIGLDNTHSLDEAEPILNSLNLAELERIQKEIDDEINGEGDKNHEANGENLEYLRSLNFGQWLAVKYDVPGPDSKYFNPNFFAADRKLQQQVMQEYMALFEADANYEKDRAFMVEELCKVEFAKKTMEEMGLDPAETNLGDLEPMLNKMKIEELNKLYQKVFYSPKPASKPSSKPTDPKPAEPKPADAEPGNDGSDDGSGNPDANPSVDSSEGDDSSKGGDVDADKDIAEKIRGIDKKMPVTVEDVKAAFAASPDARRIYGEPDDETISKTLEEIKVWKKLSDAQKADFLQNGIVLSGINLNDLNALMELQKKGILPKRGA